MPVEEAKIMTRNARMDEYNRGALQYIYCKLNGKSFVGLVIMICVEDFHLC